MNISLNCRGFDMSNHFCEWCYDYTTETYPYFTAKLEEFPSIQQQVGWCCIKYNSSKQGALGFK